MILSSLKSGGFGRNLTGADYCFLLDPRWNPATENQAVDRTHRMGPTKNAMNDDAMFSAAITADDVRGLFDV